ncbi:MAG: hypothetical protein DRN53_07335 [Thermoprotei archaeon]|nr:MAG: hypothetical protein DRN53_07335 [Thermoprotei archaeon]
MMMNINLIKRLNEALSAIAPIQELDIATAFVGENISNILRNMLADNYHVRVLVGLHLGAIDPKALKDLLDINTEVKVYMASTFHPKIYIVRKARGLENGEWLAIVGSANLSRAGLIDNIEANVAIQAASNSSIIREIAEYFEELWTSSISKELDKELLKKFEQSWSLGRTVRRTEAEEIGKMVYKSGNTAWIAVTSPENYKICIEKKLWGVERMIPTINEVKPGDILIFYVKREMKLKDIWIVETKAFESDERIWPDKTYPYRIKINLLHKASIDMKEVIYKLKFIKVPEIWGCYLQREMVKLSQEDAQVLIETLKLRGEPSVV